MYLNESTEILTIDEACELLTVGKSTIYQMLGNGAIEGAFRIGKVWKIPRKAILDYINKRMRESTKIKNERKR